MTCVSLLRHVAYIWLMSDGVALPIRPAGAGPASAALCGVDDPSRLLIPARVSPECVVT